MPGPSESQADPPWPEPAIARLVHRRIAVIGLSVRHPVYRSATRIEDGWDAAADSRMQHYPSGIYAPADFGSQGAWRSLGETNRVIVVLGTTIGLLIVLWALGVIR